MFYLKLLSVIITDVNRKIYWYLQLLKLIF